MHTDVHDHDLGDDEKEEERNECFDVNFSRLFKNNERTRNAVNRFSILKDDKFNISVDNKDIENIKQQFNDNEGVETCLDALHSHLKNNLIKDSIISTLKQIIIEEEYDAESLDIDIQIFKNCETSNVEIELKSDDVVNEIVKYVTKSKSLL